MHIVILGSGVIGTTAAYYLAKSGHQVTVIDRQEGPGLETSYANAGEISPGYSSPWAGPGVPLKAIKWMLMQHSPLVIRPMLDWKMWRWGLMMLRNCTDLRYRVNKSRMVPIAEYSRDCMKALRAETGIEYDDRARGTLQLFRTQQQLDDTAKDIEVLKQYDVPFELLDRDGFVRHEPGLALTRDKFVGALRLPNDETGDCFMFTQAIAKMAAAMGVTFRYGVTVNALQRERERVGMRGRIAALDTSAGIIEGDVYVAALGSYTPFLLRPIGIDLPVYPIKGYSITVPITDSSFAPESTIMDESHKIAVTRLGSRIRAGGTAEISGFSLELRPARRATLEHVVSDLFPRGGDVSKATFWCGLRPMTPDGTPVIGPTEYSNLWIASGHGTLGWTMAAGTGQLLADWISGRQTAIDTTELTIDRYSRRFG